MQTLYWMQQLLCVLQYRKLRIYDTECAIQWRRVFQENEWQRVFIESVVVTNEWKKKTDWVLTFM